MAKSLQERLASARATDRTTIETLAKLIDDVGTEKERLSAAHERASAESIDFALAETDRDEAAANAARYARDIAALSAAAIELGEKLETKRNSDAQRAKAAEKAAALAERDALVKNFEEQVPKMMSDLIALLEAVNANKERMRAAGMSELDAEYKARGIPNNGAFGAAPAPLFAKMKIPEFSGPGRAWPVDHFARTNAAVLENASKSLREQQERAEAERLAKQKALGEEQAQFGRYSVIANSTARYPVRIDPALIEGDLPSSIGNMQPWRGVLSHSVAEKLQNNTQLTVDLISRGRS